MAKPLVPKEFEEEFLRILGSQETLADVLSRPITVPTNEFVGLSDRMYLSADTWIDGGHLYTDDGPLACAWPLGAVEVFAKVRGTYQWVIVGNLRQLFVHENFRLPRAIARECYQFVEGGAGILVDQYNRVTLIPANFPPFLRDRGLLFARSASLLCDTAEQFRALHEWIMEASHE